MQVSTILATLKAAVLKVQPEASVILFGSRARKDNRPDSDFDFLVLSPEKLTRSQQRAIRESAYQLELQVGKVLTLLFRTEADWRGRLSITPLFKEIEKDGLRL